MARSTRTEPTLPRRTAAPRPERRRATIPLVDAAHFLVATRDSGYRSTAWAVAELVENSVQAGATTIDIEIARGDDPMWPLEIRVADNGCGMDEPTLHRALAFGGSTRFDDRDSLGRYGMGLPNGGLSRARRIEVYTWQGRHSWFATLDLDQQVDSGRAALAPAISAPAPPFAPRHHTGTVVILRKCDRLEHQRASTVAAHLTRELGRIYRWILAKRELRISVNGESVRAEDPLMLMPESVVHGGRPFGSVLRYRLPGHTRQGVVEVRFSELPISEWHNLPTAEKRRLGVTGTPSVSIVRADREIDRGWFFMGGKRRENYDDWWRCEVRFDPQLDELFGITHSKQGINPTETLRAELESDLEPIARALNSRVRRGFEILRSSAPISEAERRAESAARRLPPLPRRTEKGADNAAPQGVLVQGSSSIDSQPTHRIVIQDLTSTNATEVIVAKNQLTLFINAHHPVYRQVIAPLAESERPEDARVAVGLFLSLLASAHAEAALAPRERRCAARMRQAWSDIASTFLNG